MVGQRKEAFVLLLNSQGFLHNKEDIENLVVNNKPKIICLTETHVTDDISETELKIENYDMVQCITRNGRTGGVMTFVQKKIKFETITNKNINQNVWINTIQLKEKYNGIVICNVYHSPSESDGAFIDEIIKECEKLVHLGHILVIGDYNDSKRLIRKLGCMGLKQYVKDFTRVMEKTETIIDLVFSNFHVDTEVLKTSKITDHQIVKINIFEINESKNKITEFYARDFSNFDENTFNENLRNDIEGIWNAKACVDEMANNIVTSMVANINRAAPLTKRRKTEKWREKPWITREVREARTRRDGAYIRAIRAKVTRESREWKEYRKRRNIVVQTIRKNKNKYYEDNIEASKTKPKQMWKTMKTLIGNKKSEQNTKGIIFNGHLAQGQSDSK